MSDDVVGRSNVADIYPNGVEGILGSWERLSEQQISSLSTEFAFRKWVRIRSFLDQSSIMRLKLLWDDLSGVARRRNVVICHDNFSSKRAMLTLSAVDIDIKTTLVNEIYRHPVVIDCISRITGDNVVPMDDEVEKYVLNCLERTGDVHGAHRDTFPYSCSYLLYSSQGDSGGRLIFSENYHDARLLHGISMDLEVGDLFLFKSDEIIHQVSPMLSNCKRVVLNMGYATEITRGNFSYSRNILYNS